MEKILKKIGSLKMFSSTKDTFSKIHTEFQLKFDEELFSINKPYLKRGYCELLNDKPKIVVSIIYCISLFSNA